MILQFFGKRFAVVTFGRDEPQRLLHAMEDRAQIRHLLDCRGGCGVLVLGDLQSFVFCS
jgi:hypothetical protein